MKILHILSQLHHSPTLETDKLQYTKFLFCVIEHILSSYYIPDSHLYFLPQEQLLSHELHYWSTPLPNTLHSPKIQFKLLSFIIKFDHHNKLLIIVAIIFPKLVHLQNIYYASHQSYVHIILQIFTTPPANIVVKLNAFPSLYNLQ